jgi:hypothetical protein
VQQTVAKAMMEVMDAPHGNWLGYYHTRTNSIRAHWLCITYKLVVLAGRRRREFNFRRLVFLRSNGSISSGTQSDNRQEQKERQEITHHIPPV